MSLKFWLGGEGSDKSRRLIEYILEEADRNPDRQYLFVVPEQMGLATQRELVMRSRNHGILNIDVLSFTRLAHRISDEVGSYTTDVTTLDDMGKSLIIGMLATKYRQELEVFGDNIDKLGYIDKIKSVISEFMQYGITVEKAYELSEVTAKAGRALLAKKLKDIAFLYREFKDHNKDKYTTVEETLDLVSSLVPHSLTVRNSIVIFDGFTGFTPVQNKLIGVLMDHALGIHVALLYEDCIQISGDESGLREHELFYLSKKTMDNLERMADERRLIIEDSYKSRNYNKNNICNKINEIVYGIKNADVKLNNANGIHLFIGQDPSAEIKIAVKKIMSLVRDEGYQYKDIAIMTGDIDNYRHPVEREFHKHGIPFFIDRTEPVLLNPFIEYIRAFIDIISDNYSIPSVFRFLKTGLTGLDDREINMLENYCLAANIRGYKKWHTRFDAHTVQVGADELLELNSTRDKLISRCDLFSMKLTGSTEKHINAASAYTVKEFSKALYHLIESDSIEERLKGEADKFEDDGKKKQAGEYRKIYVQIMNILDELCELIPDEKTDIRGFGNLLDAGLDAIRIGILPNGMDYVQIGDLTRSRFDNIKAMFIVGANDGVIPRPSPGGGLINERERDFLIRNTEGLVLAPSSNEELYSQQLYIYMAINKPEEHLYVSYSRSDGSGNSLLPSYIIGRIKEAYPELTVETDSELCEFYYDAEEAFDEFTGLIFPALVGTLPSEKAERLKELTRYFLASEKYRKRLMRIINNTILRAGADASDSIGAAVARAIYGTRISSSITRLENYAKCAYRYFLEYGLKLKEREIFSLEAKDIGNIFHDSMREYSELMEKSGNNWINMPKDVGEQLMDKAVDTVMVRYRDSKLSSSARYAYMEHRVRKVMRKSADIVSAQVRKGSFIPRYFEVDFDTLEKSDAISIRLSDDEWVRLRGRIDRVDTCESEDGLYIRIIDYKSSEHDIDLAAVYEGRQLQLLVYLNVVIDGEKKLAQKDGRNIAVHPAGVLYYHIDDPLIETGESLTAEDIEKLIMKKLSLNGIVNSDPDVIRLMDSGIDNDPTVLPLSLKKNGELKKTKHAVSENDLEVLSEHVTRKIKAAGCEILSGNIAIPKPDNKTRFTGPDCSFCPYTAICNTGKQPDPEQNDDGSDKAMTNEDWIRLMKSE